jgi:hypothetical protein
MAVLTRFRALRRDRQTDVSRLAPAQKALGRALIAIEREQEGLSRRLEEARMSAASLLGNESGIYFEREPEDERMLIEAEAQMMRAYARLDELKAQHATMSEMVAKLNAAVDALGRSDDPPALAGRRGSGSTSRAVLLETLGHRLRRAAGWGR